MFIKIQEGKNHGEIEVARFFFSKSSDVSVEVTEEEANGITAGKMWFPKNIVTNWGELKKHFKSWNKNDEQ